MLGQIKRFIPKPLFSLYHWLLAQLANFIYRYPSEKLIVIGVTGTSGKSTVVYLLSRVLASAGYKVGAAATIFFKIDQKEWLNDKKMTMLGRFALQRLISQMAQVNCQYAIIETSSEGIKQHRQLGINYDLVLLTNLYPEHLEAHGGFANYKKAKLKLFNQLKTQPPKLIAGQKIPKTIIVNLDQPEAAEFLAPAADEKFAFTLTNQSTSVGRVVRAEKIKVTGQGLEFQVDNVPFRLQLLGEHNVSNALAVISIGLSQGLSLASLAKSLALVAGVPGRLEFINGGQPFKIIVDYAFEPRAMEKLYQVVKLLPHQKVIQVLGSAGGGRDQARRPVLGQLAGQNADYVIVTNEDPYDQDPQTIIEAVAAGAREKGKILNQNLFTILDRRSAIAKALGLAQPGDLVLITGKGSEQAIVGKNNQKIPWDDRLAVAEELKKLQAVSNKY